MVFVATKINNCDAAEQIIPAKEVGQKEPRQKTVKHKFSRLLRSNTFSCSNAQVILPAKKDTIHHLKNQQDWTRKSVAQKYELAKNRPVWIERSISLWTYSKHSLQKDVRKRLQASEGYQQACKMSSFQQTLFLHALYHWENSPKKDSWAFLFNLNCWKSCWSSQLYQRKLKW